MCSAIAPKTANLYNQFSAVESLYNRCTTKSPFSAISGKKTPYPAEAAGQVL